MLCFLRNLGAVVLGLIIGSIVIGLIERLTSVVYTLPPLPTTLEEWPEFARNLPDGVFAIVMVAHICGTAVAALIAILVGNARPMTLAMIVGVLFLIAGFLNVRMIPHPAWYNVADIASYLPTAFIIGGLMEIRQRPRLQPA